MVSTQVMTRSPSGRYRPAGPAARAARASRDITVPMEPRHVRNLLVREPLQLAEHERLAELGAERLDLSLDPARLIAADRCASGSGVSCSGTTAAVSRSSSKTSSVCPLRERNDQQAFRTMEEGKSPARPLAPEAVEMAKRAHVGLLQDVLRVGGVAHQPARQVPGGAHVRDQGALERVDFCCLAQAPAPGCETPATASVFPVRTTISIGPHESSLPGGQARRTPAGRGPEARPGASCRRPSPEPLPTPAPPGPTTCPGARPSGTTRRGCRRRWRARRARQGPCALPSSRRSTRGRRRRGAARCN